MDSITTNISMPKGLYEKAKSQAKKYHYNSVSELIRDALRWWMNDNLTRNGFTPEFEESVLKAEKEADKGNVVEWDGKGDFVDFVLNNPAFKKNGQTAIDIRVSPKSKRVNRVAAKVRRRNRQTGAVV